MKFRAISYPDYHASQQVLPFPPPMAEHALAPDRFKYAWKMLTYCFEFPDPRSATAASSDVPPDDRVFIERYFQKAISLARSPFLAHDTSVTVNVDDDGEGEEVIAVMPHEESERGFMTLLRQFVHAGEPASFNRVFGLAMLHDAGNGEPNHGLLTGWGRLHKKLLARTPVGWAYLKALLNQRADEIPHARDPRVDQLLKTYFYGDIIHFGEGRDDLQVLSADTFGEAHNRMNLYQGASGLAMYYIGFATIIDRVYGLSAPQR